MKFTYVLSAMLFVLIVVSGCIGIQDVFGRDVISVQQNTVKNGVRDVITLKDINTIPKSPLLPDQQVIFSFISANNDNLKKAHMAADLFNAPTMRDVTGAKPCNLYTGTSGTTGSVCQSCLSQGYSGACPSTSECTTTGPCPNNDFQICQATTGSPEQSRYCVPDQCAMPNGCDVLPGEEKQVNFFLRTPGEAEIANIKTDTKLDFKVVYDFDGTLTYLIPAISTDEIIKRQRSGDKTTLFTSRSYSSGPVQVDVQIQGAPYMLSDSSGRITDTVLLFSIKNVGSGNIVNSQINSGDMTIVFPPEFVADEERHSDKFECTKTNEGTLCINVGKGGEDRTRPKNDPNNIGIIPLYKDESRSSLYFTVHIAQPLQEPFRTFQISSYVTYRYELRNSVALTINPFQNV